MSDVKVRVINWVDDDFFYEFTVPTVDDAPNPGDSIRVGAGMFPILSVTSSTEDDITTVTVAVDTRVSPNGNG